MAGWIDPDRRLVRSAPWLVADVALAALFVWITVVSLRSDAYVDQYGPIEGAGWVLALSPTLLLPFRRLAPLSVLGVATVLYLVASATQGDSNAPLAAPFFAYPVGVSRPPAVSGPIVAVAATALSTATLFGPGDPDPLVGIVWFLLLGSGWLVAISIRRNQTRAELLRREVAELERQRAEVARTAIADERARIARELHDAVGHAVNVIVLQAGAARLTADPDRAIDALGEIEQLGRGALTDLDQLLGLLDDSDHAARAPTRSMSDVDTLVAELRSAGADITLDNRCHDEVDWHIGAAAHRIAQEALTNAVKHAGPAHIEVTVSCTARELRLVITDDGLGADAPAARDGGRGIPGMAERAKVLGGRLTAKPLTEGGFVVEAVLPRTPRRSPSRSSDPDVTVPT